jgi:hypothetical protein
LKIDNSLSSIDYSTVFGNNDVTAQFSPSAFLVDKCQNVYASGWGGNILSSGSQVNNMPITTNAFQPNTADGYDFYLIVLSRDVESLLYGTYFGVDLIRTALYISLFVQAVGVTMIFRQQQELIPKLT